MQQLWYVKEYTHPTCWDKGPLRFDFAIFASQDDYKAYKKDRQRLDNPLPIALIEHDGAQHHRPVDKFGGEAAYRHTRRHDQQKTQWATDNGIKLMRISITPATQGSVGEDMLAWLEQVGFRRDRYGDISQSQIG